jgi:S1-C subfamily serine protease
MSEPSPPRHSTRETRLLLLTLAVSVAALLLLARFRFPERPLTDLSPPQPLTRLTRVTAFDELSAMLRDLLRQFEGAVVLAQTPGATLGLLVRDDLALVPLPAGGRVEAVAGSPLPANGIVARDEQRGLAVVRVPGYTAAEISVQPPATPLDAPGYVAILEAAADGPTIRAEFVSRYSMEPHAGWDQPVLALSGPAGAKPGSLLFTLSGRFVGMTLADSGRLLVVPADALMTRATRLANGENVIAVASGIDVQAITPAITKATGAREGVVVSDVSPEAVSSVSAPAAGAGASAVGAGGAAGAGAPGATNGGVSTSAPARTGGPDISIGDVITAAAGRPVRAPRDWQQILRAHTPGATIGLSLVRFGKPLQATLTLPRTAASSSSNASAAGGASATGASGAAGAAGTSASAASDASAPSPLEVMGLSLRGATGGSEVIAIRAASPAARAGLRAGDRITSLPGRATSGASPSPNAIATACAELASSQALLLAIDRDGASRIFALEKP